ncbi:hypothetical protein ACH4TS_31390 [Streptomyces albidoflavus]
MVTVPEPTGADLEPATPFRPAQEAATPASAAAHQQAARTKHPDAVRAEALLKARKERAARATPAPQSVNALTGQCVDR